MALMIKETKFSPTYTVKIYEPGGKKNGKFIVTISEATFDADSIKQIESNISLWKKRFDIVESDAIQSDNYDHWIEIWNDDYQSAFGPSFVQGNVTYVKSGGRRPKKTWSEVFSGPALNWMVTNIEI